MAYIAYTTYLCFKMRSICINIVEYDTNTYSSRTANNKFQKADGTTDVQKVEYRKICTE